MAKQTRINYDPPKKAWCIRYDRKVEPVLVHSESASGATKSVSFYDPYPYSNPRPNGWSQPTTRRNFDTYDTYEEARAALMLLLGAEIRTAQSKVDRLRASRQAIAQAPAPQFPATPTEEPTDD